MNQNFNDAFKDFDKKFERFDDNFKIFDQFDQIFGPPSFVTTTTTTVDNNTTTTTTIDNNTTTTTTIDNDTTTTIDNDTLIVDETFCLESCPCKHHVTLNGVKELWDGKTIAKYLQEHNQSVSEHFQEIN